MYCITKKKLYSNKCWCCTIVQKHKPMDSKIYIIIIVHFFFHISVASEFLGLSLKKIQKKGCLTKARKKETLYCTSSKFALQLNKTWKYENSAGNYNTEIYEYEHTITYTTCQNIVLLAIDKIYAFPVYSQCSTIKMVINIILAVLLLVWLNKILNV